MRREKLSNPVYERPALALALALRLRQRLRPRLRPSTVPPISASLPVPLHLLLLLPVPLTYPTFIPTLSRIPDMCRYPWPYLNLQWHLPITRTCIRSHTCTRTPTHAHSRRKLTPPGAIPVLAPLPILSPKARLKALLQEQEQELGILSVSPRLGLGLWP